MIKHIMPLAIVSLLATCTSPSYANNHKVYTRVNGNNDIATHYQSLNSDSFILVDMAAVSGNNSCATPHCVVRLGRLIYKRRTTAPICGFFVRAIQLCPRYDGLDGDTFGCAGFLLYQSANPVQSVTMSLAAWVMDSQSKTKEVNHD